VPPLLKVNPAESTDHRAVTGLILLDLRNLEAMENFLSRKVMWGDRGIDVVVAYELAKLSGVLFCTLFGVDPSG
jgi:hypothetical protein